MGSAAERTESSRPSSGRTISPGHPSGEWDQATEDAMKKYQADHGWQPGLRPTPGASSRSASAPTTATPFRWSQGERAHSARHSRRQNPGLHPHHPKLSGRPYRPPLFLQVVRSRTLGSGCFPVPPFGGPEIVWIFRSRTVCPGVCLSEFGKLMLRNLKSIFAMPGPERKARIRRALRNRSQSYTAKTVYSTVGFAAESSAFALHARISPRLAL